MWGCGFGRISIQRSAGAHAPTLIGQRARDDLDGLHTGVASPHQGASQRHASPAPRGGGRAEWTRPCYLRVYRVPARRDRPGHEFGGRGRPLVTLSHDTDYPLGEHRLVVDHNHSIWPTPCVATSSARGEIPLRYVESSSRRPARFPGQGRGVESSQPWDRSPRRNGSLLERDQDDSLWLPA